MNNKTFLLALVMACSVHITHSMYIRKIVRTLIAKKAVHVSFARKMTTDICPWAWEERFLRNRLDQIHYLIYLNKLTITNKTLDNNCNNMYRLFYDQNRSNDICQARIRILELKKEAHDIQMKLASKK